jgi:hypothetical protein
MNRLRFDRDLPGHSLLGLADLAFSALPTCSSIPRSVLRARSARSWQ